MVGKWVFRMISILLVLVFSGCSTMMTVQAIDADGRPINEATVSVNSKVVGQTPNASTSVSNFVGSTPSIQVQASGYQTNTTKPDKEIKVGSLVGGLFLWPLFLWCYGPKAIQNVTLAPAAPATQNQTGRRNSVDAAGVEGALARAAEEMLKNVPTKSKIAIVYITAEDKSSTDYISGELEFIWVNAGYAIIDRSELNRIRREQNFQVSGEVDDDTAVSIGKFSGADIIVTGRVDGEGNLRRLRLRALNTQNAQVIGVASERL